MPRPGRPLWSRKLEIRSSLFRRRVAHPQLVLQLHDLGLHRARVGAARGEDEVGPEGLEGRGGGPGEIVDEAKVVVGIHEPGAVREGGLELDDGLGVALLLGADDAEPVAAVRGVGSRKVRPLRQGNEAAESFGSNNDVKQNIILVGEYNSMTGGLLVQNSTVRTNV